MSFYAPTALPSQTQRQPPRSRAKPICVALAVVCLALALVHSGAAEYGLAFSYLLAGVAATQAAAKWQPRAARQAHRRTRLAPDAPVDVLMVAYYYPPHNEVGAYRPYRFARALRSLGSRVSVVCSSEMLRRATDQAALAQEATETVAPQRVPGPQPGRFTAWLSRRFLQVQRLVLPYDDRLGWLPHAVAAAARTLSRNAIILSTSPPVATHMTALVLKLRYRCPWVADFRDPLWGNPGRTSRRASWLDPAIEWVILTVADAVIANTDPAAEILRRRYPAQARKIHTIWNGFDPDDVFAPVPAQPRDRRTLSHIGTLYHDRTPLPFLLCLERLAAMGAIDPGSIQFRQIGRFDRGCFSVEHPALPRLNAAQAIYHSARHMPREDARREMLDADVLLLLDINATNPGLQVPAKTFEYVRSGRPIVVLTVPGSATEHVLGLSGVPHLCIDVDQLDSRLDPLILQFLLADHPRVDPRPAFVQKFSSPEQVHSLLAILKSVRRPAYAVEPADY